MIAIFSISTFGLTHADILDPAEQACAGRSNGDTCSDSGETCQEGECCRNIYNGDSNGDDSFETVCEPCLECKATPATGGQATAGQTTRGEPTAGEVAEMPTNESSDSSTTADEDEGCASATTALSPFGLFCGFIGLLMMVGLRRARE